MVGLRSEAELKAQARMIAWRRAEFCCLWFLLLAPFLLLMVLGVELDTFLGLWVGAAIITGFCQLMRRRYRNILKSMEDDDEY